MCGIAGATAARHAPVDRTVLKRMTDALAHRGPDGEGLWIADDGAVGLGHRRLSIIDLSSFGAQPMESASGRFVLSYNGEVYNYLSLRDELAGLGYRFAGHSDTEVIVAGCQHWGLEKTLSRLAGMFALALWDKQERTLSLARDRIGIKPLYYTVKDGALAFASELRPIVAWRGSLPEISLRGLSEFLRLGYVPSPLSIFEGVHKLPPATVLTFHDGQTAGPRPYWSVGETVARGFARQRQDETAVLDELDARLREIVSQHMISDVPLGAFLSGGIDSSTVTALMQAGSSQPVKTFSIGFEDPAYNEAKHAAEVAAHLKTDHTELYVSEQDALAVIPSLPDIYDEPFADISQIPTYLVAKLARERVTVSLSGDGGDELFGGYNRYTFVSNYWDKLNRIPRPLRSLAAAGINAASPATWDSAFRLFGPALPQRLRPALPGQKMQKIASVLAAPTLYDLQSRLISQWPHPEAVLASGAGSVAEALLPPPVEVDGIPSAAQQMAWDTSTYLVDDILTKVDRATMRVGLEARVPLLDHRLVEFAWEIPLSMKFRDGSGKYVLKRLLERYVPRQLFERPKMGFGIPVDSWLRGPLKSWASNYLSHSDHPVHDLFDRAAIDATWREHLGGRIDRGGQLWTVLMFDSWLQRARQWV
ncbi:asparagine synthase (glutamine-hydrolyzing) [Rhodopseudomonas sp. BR0M22]|uniref:asparagine synthase (glutamine-hydrolyzing) n=1 Tax=Rhodopseudomonas sp. BR0M22 TaxID=2269369 RepID=UPI0013E020B4|nr:asparagine synthase (glutamine-hydrolyzing) [Rhodopseudomonas sp. BR0M22]NEW91512.1 asparagine synthase (glutamine-hydrolyzing) [Rhodopseudomonas sp. BR0M22]